MIKVETVNGDQDIFTLSEANFQKAKEEAKKKLGSKEGSAKLEAQRKLDRSSKNFGKVAEVLKATSASKNEPKRSHAELISDALDTKMEAMASTVVPLPKPYRTSTEEPVYAGCFLCEQLTGVGTNYGEAIIASEISGCVVTSTKDVDYVVCTDCSMKSKIISRSFHDENNKMFRFEHKDIIQKFMKVQDNRIYVDVPINVIRLNDGMFQATIWGTPIAALAANRDWAVSQAKLSLLQQLADKTLLNMRESQRLHENITTADQ